MAYPAFRKILAVRIGPIGDMVMITPALRAMLDHFGEASVDVLTSRLGAKTLANFDSRIRNFHVLERRHFLYPLHKKRMIGLLRDEDYDAVFCFEANPNIHRYFTDFRARLFVPAPDFSGHASQASLDCVARGMGAASGVLGRERYPLNLPVDPEAARVVDMQLEEMGIPKSRTLIGLHPSFGGKERLVGRLRYSTHNAWPSSYWARLAELIAKEIPGAPVLMRILPGDRKTAEEIEKLSGGAATPWISSADFELYKAYLRRVNVFITPNSGPMHVAAATGCPKIIALFSRELPEQNGPFISPDRYSVIRAETCRTPGEGLASIMPEEVLDTAVNAMHKLRQ